MTVDLSKFRNIGISAHIDSGKTTLTERILFYTNRIHAIHDVRGKDGVGAKMDSMELERERGITIQSAATFCEWQGHHVNIIDTPGHVDFTIEVERALRVLDGAILVLCSVAGVQSQSMTVDRQMRRYNVPRIAFVNKCDRQGANPVHVRDQLREKLKLNAQLIQYPIGLEDGHKGIVDLVKMRAFVFEGEHGEEIVESDIPADLVEEVEAYREELLDAVSMFNDAVMEGMLEENLTEETLRAAIRDCTIKMQICPVLLGSAYKNKAVQPVLDAVIDYLPNPVDVDNTAVRLDDDDKEETFVLPCTDTGPFVGLAFKLEDGRYGQLTYVRLYSGKLQKGETIMNGRTKKKVKVGRLVRMHSDEMEDIITAEAGDIVALFGVDCASGDTFTNGRDEISMTSMHVPDAVVSITLKPIDSKAQQNMSKALQRFTKEDPTFRVTSDPETGETIVSGMGELHVEVYIERMKREYGAEVDVSPPRVSYREAISRKAVFNYTHKKQTGGSGQYGRVAGFVEPLDEGNYEFNNKIKGGSIPTEFISAVNKGFKSMMVKGTLVGAAIEGVSVTINDGQSHSVDSSDNAFQAAARGAFREAYAKAGPIVLEPLMRVVLEGPVEFHGQMVTTLVQRRGMVMGTTETAGYAEVEAEVPLGEMFGYATVLRSATQGRAEFTMEFARYAKAPNNVSETLIAEYRDSLEA
jgi:elongation factor G